MGGGFGNINHTLQSMNEAYLAFPGANGYMPWAYYPILYCGLSLQWDSHIYLQNSLQ